jgi:hypothetical protein
MELLDVRLTGIQRRNRAAFVRRSELPGAPELIPGQRVVLRDEQGEFFAGTVVEAVDEADERYLVHLGVRLPEEFALMRLGRIPQQPDRRQEQEILDLLGDARATLVRQMPGQRRVN